MGKDTVGLLKELQASIEDSHRRALVDAYLEKPGAQSIVDEALRLLSKAIDENQTT